MKTITKRSLDELAKEMPVIEETEMRQVIGGDRFVFDENGELLKRIKDPNNYFVVGSQEISLGDDLSSPCYGGTGANFEGGALTKEVFEFMAKNTNVEWALSLNDSGTKGYLVTSNNQHSVKIDSIPREGYQKLYHSHGSGVDPNASTEYKDIYNNPSLQDLEMAKILEKEGFIETCIYNTSNGVYQSYVSSSKSMEEDAEEKGYEVKKK